LSLTRVLLALAVFVLLGGHCRAVAEEEPRYGGKRRSEGSKGLDIL
jgi:hypothetical protein